jgi:hypothetical protein
MATLAFHQFAAVLRHLRAALWPVDAPAKGAAA